MDRCVWGLFTLLVACGAPSAELARTPASDCSPSACPDCPPARCTERACPTCPVPLPLPPPPEAKDWHCFSARLRTRRGDTSYCWISREICQTKRPKVRKRLRDTSACASQPVAHCFRIAEPASLSRQSMCTRTREHCDEVRVHFLEQKSKLARASPCQPMLNRNLPFDTSFEAFEAKRYQE